MIIIIASDRYEIPDDFMVFCRQCCQRCSDKTTGEFSTYPVCQECGKSTSLGNCFLVKIEPFPIGRKWRGFLPKGYQLRRPENMIGVHPKIHPLTGNQIGFGIKQPRSQTSSLSPWKLIRFVHATENATQAASELSEFLKSHSLPVDSRGK